MLKSVTLPRAVLGTLAGALVGMAAQASATPVLPTTTDCTTASTDPNCFHFKGSDTLLDIIRTGITNARTAGVTGAKNLYYDGTGSGNAETQMTTLTGSDLAVQSIGPMSRNFRPKFIDQGSNTYVQRDATHLSNAGHNAWSPDVNWGQVIGLDAAVIVTKNADRCANLVFGTMNNNFNTGYPSFKQAIVNDPATYGDTSGGGNLKTVYASKTLPLSFGDSSAFGKDITSNIAGKYPTVNYSNVMMVILSGVDGSGSLKACSDPRRVQALQDLANCMGVDHIEHIFRRDDNSGTTDTFKDRIMTVNSSSDPVYPWIGGRFCNGQSIGGINSATPQTGICSVTRTIANCVTSDVAADTGSPAKTVHCPGTETCLFNLNNQDLDPVRRSCLPADSTHAPTTCTDMTTGLACTADDGNTNCTQGVIVALSDTDAGSTDVTTSIAARLNSDPAGVMMGYAGREASKSTRGTKGLKMNGLGFTDSNVRAELYLLSRRLFLQNTINTNTNWPGFTIDPAIRATPASTPNQYDDPDDKAGPSNGLTGQGEPQIEAEQNYFNWLAQNNTGAPDHTNVDPILTQFGFITCDPNSTNPYNPTGLCGKYPVPPAAGPLAAAYPNGAPTTLVTSAGNIGTGGAKLLNSIGGLGALTSGNAPTCGGNGFCASTGVACVSGATCPTYAGRPANSACSVDSDCASGLHCTDVLGIGIPGQPVSLLCQ